MKTENHSEGTWIVSGDSIITDAFCIANIETDGGYEAPPEQREANARLLAAAPDLLSALRDLLEIGQAKAAFHVAECNMARAAIAKATKL